MRVVFGVILLSVFACKTEPKTELSDEQVADIICDCSRELVDFNKQVLENRRNYTREEMMGKMKEAEGLRQSMLACLDKDLQGTEILPERDPQVMVQLRLRCSELPRNIATEILRDIRGEE